MGLDCLFLLLLLLYVFSFLFHSFDIFLDILVFLDLAILWDFLAVDHLRYVLNLLWLLPDFDTIDSGQLGVEIIKIFFFF